MIKNDEQATRPRCSNSTRPFSNTVAPMLTVLLEWRESDGVKEGWLFPGEKEADEKGREREKRRGRKR